MCLHAYIFALTATVAQRKRRHLNTGLPAQFPKPQPNQLLLACKPMHKLTKRVVLIAISSRIVILFLCVFFGNLLVDYDTSTSLLLPYDIQLQQLTVITSPQTEPCSPNGEWLWKRVTSHLVKWDAVYFTSISERGYQNEQSHAFFPGLPMLNRVLASRARKKTSCDQLCQYLQDLLQGVTMRFMHFQA